MIRCSRFLVLPCVTLLGCASGGTVKDKPPAAPPPEAAADYYPLATGWKWAYQLEKSGEKILATYAVLEQIVDTVIVKAGDERLTYALMPEGVARRSGLEI